MEVKQIDISQIVVDNDQPRKHYSEETLQGLADSIRQHGMLNPITVTPLRDRDKYQIVTGERRWRAASMARLEAIPCVVKDKEIHPDERMTEQLIENLQREDLQPLEKGGAIQHVKTTLNQTNREIARRLGLSRAHRRVSPRPAGPAGRHWGSSRFQSQSSRGWAIDRETCAVFKAVE